MRSWLRHLQCERGIALITALGMLGVLTIAAGTLTVYTTGNSRSAQGSKAQEVAYSLAEAGIGESLSILHAALDPRTASLLPSTTVSLPGGQVTYSGTLNTTTWIWTITSVGKATNPNGTGLTQRVLTRKATLHGLIAGASVDAWNRIVHNDPNTCLTIDSVNIPSSISSVGDICLQNAATITGSTTKVSAGDDITLTALQSNDVGGGTGSGWTTSTNVGSSNDTYATTSIAGSGSSANLNTSNFGLAVPSNATVTGIRARIERKASATSSLSDLDVYLLKAGNQIGNDKAAAGTWGTTDATATYGSSTDLWGTTWTPAEVNASTFGLRLKVQNANASSRTASVDYMELTVYYSIPSKIGASGAGNAISNLDVVGTCKLDSNAAHSPCGTSDNAWATNITTNATDLVKPTIDLPYWYDNAMPGPKHNCTTGSVPGGFDSNSTYDYSRASYEVTPTNTSYTCEYRDAQGTLVGQLSWNHTTHVLLVQGTIFFDGDFRFDDDGQLVNYQGRAIIYATGDVEFDELVCAGGNGSRNCVNDGMQNWDPTQNLLIVLSGDDSEYDQGATQAQAVPSGLQGIVYAKDDCTIHENFYSSGPLICDRIILPSAANGWPTYTTWPNLGSLIDGMKYGSVSTSPDFEIDVGDQSG